MKGLVESEIEKGALPVEAGRLLGLSENLR
jgi:hypothetical protein